jgi:hypothetical protein
MKRAISWTIVLIAVSTMWAQDEAAGKAQLQSRLAELKKAIAANKARLAKYQWLQTTEVAVKGEVKKKDSFQCRYGADGKLQKTPLETNQPEKAPPGGLKGKLVAKKVAEMKDYNERLKSLISHYVPPDPQKLQAAAQAGHASVQPSEGSATLAFTDYYKPGDKLSITFDTAAKKLTGYEVNTYLDDPKKDVVTLTNQFATLDDGTNYLQQTVLDAEGKDIKVTTTNQGHSLIPK